MLRYPHPERVGGGFFQVSTAQLPATQVQRREPVAGRQLTHRFRPER